MEDSKVSQPRQSDSKEAETTKNRREQIKRWRKVQDRYKHVKNAAIKQDRVPTKVNNPGFNFCPHIESFNWVNGEKNSSGASPSRPSSAKIDIQINPVSNNSPKLDITESLRYLSSQIKASEKVSLPQLAQTPVPPGRTRTSVKVRRRVSHASSDMPLTPRDKEEVEENIAVEFKTKLPPLVPYKAITSTLTYLTVRGTVSELSSTIQDWREHIFTEEDWSQYTEEVSHALLIAVNCGKDESVQELILAGGDPNCLNSTKCSPLLAMAAAVGNVKSVQHLMSAGALVDRGPKGETAVHVAARDGRLDLLKVLLEGDDVESMLRNMSLNKRANVSPLLGAVRNGSAECVSFLVEKGCLVDASDRDKKTPLHLAAESGHKEIVKTLKDHGANVFAICDDSNATPFVLAVQKGHRELAMEDLLAPGGINTQDFDPQLAEFLEYTMLMYACGAGDLDAVKLLLEKGADLNVTAQGYHAIYPAIINKHTDIVKHLLPFLDINEDSCNGETPLLVALKNHDEDLAFLSIFIDGGADVNKGTFNTTPLMYTAANSKPKALKWLLKKGADPNIKHRKFNITALWHAASSGSMPCIKTMVRYNPNMFLTRTVNTIHNTTVLEEALDHEDLELVRLLVSAGCSLNHLAESKDKLWHDKTKALLERSQNPRTLQEVAKLTIKNTLGHIEVDQKIDTLPLPKSLRDYLSSRYVDYLFVDESDDDEDDDSESDDSDDDDDDDDGSSDDNSSSGSANSDSDSDS